MRPLAVAVAVGVVTVGTGTLVLLQTPRPAPSAAQEGTGAPPTTVSLAIGGAVSFGGRTLPLLDDPAGPFAGTADVLRAADVTLVDLVAPEDGSAPPAAAITALTDAGVDGVGRLDPRWSGPAGTETTAGLAAAGLGHGDTWVAHTGPLAVSVLSGTADPTDRSRLLAGVTGADRAGDVVVVRLAAPPGGDCPGAAPQELTAALVAAGADVVVGGAPAGGPGSWAGADDAAWVLPAPGPLLLAGDGGPVDSEVVVLRVGPDGVRHVETVLLRTDAFGRALPAAAAPPRTPPCTPPVSR